MMRGIAPILLTLLLACSGGSSGSSVASGGTGISSGPITAIGSFFVTGTEWSVGPDGEVLLDGEPFSESDLSLGMVVTVEGTRAADGTGTATRVEFDDEIEGPLDPASYDPATCPSPDETCFTVFGQRFVADRNTSYAGTSFDGFRAFFSPSPDAVDAVVEVSGLEDVHPTQGIAIRATRIEVKEPDGPVIGETKVELEGTVENLVGDQFEIGPVTVTLNAAGCLPTDTSDLEGPLENGDAVEVEGRFLGVNEGVTEVCAEVLESEDALPDIDEFEIEGIVTQVTDNASFWLAGIEVDAATAAFEPANLQVQQGMRLEVEGALAGGVLVAEEVEQRGEVEIEAVVTQSDVVQVSSEVFSGSFTLLDRSIVVDIETEVEGGLPVKDSFVEVHAVDDGSGGLTATEVNVQPFAAADRVRVQGRVEAAPQSSEDPRTLVIAGITIPTNDATQCRDADEQAIACADFFAQVRVGDEVQATDTDEDYETFGRANELEFED
jgi:hypothetical protein